MRIINASIFGEDGRFEQKSVCIDGQRITKVSVSTETSGRTVDLDGYRLMPGLVDIHVHGALGHDAMQADASDIQQIASYLVTRGVTSFCLTTMAAPEEQLRVVASHVRAFNHRREKGAVLLGLRLEGPFLNPQMSCAHETAYLQHPSWPMIKRLIKDYPGLILMIDLAPELPGALPFIAKAREHMVISLGHSVADYACAVKAFLSGATHVTHLFNAMIPLHHRHPGLIGAALDTSGITAELIGDAHHLHPSVLRLAFSVLTRQRVVLVSDAMSALGMPDGEYRLGGRMIIVENGRATYDGDRLAGSVTGLWDQLCYLESLGLPLERTLPAATINPARVLGVDRMIGSIAVGKYADLFAVDDRGEIAKVWVKGQLVYDSDDIGVA